MSDPGEWSETFPSEAPAPKKKRGLLFWLATGCGCGCLGVVALVLVLAYFVRQATDADRQWPQLRHLIAFDQRPEHLDLHYGVEWFDPHRFEVGEEGTPWTGVFLCPESDATLRSLVDPASKENIALGEVETGKTTIQGREVDLLFIRTVLDTSSFPKWVREWSDMPAGQHEVQRTARADLSGPGGRRLVLDLVSDPEHPPTAEAVQQFLEPFDVWREP